jgi:hypothetical protein
VLLEAQQLGRVIHLNSPAPGLSSDLAVIEHWRSTLNLGRPIGARADVWVSYREQADGCWQDDPNICPAAPVFRLGIYLINDLVRLFGRAAKINVLSSRLFTLRPSADNAQLGIAFENGALANIYASFCVEDGDHYRNSLILNFEHGTVYRNVGPQREGDHATLSVVMGTPQEGRKVIDTQQVTLVSGLYDWAGFAAAVHGESDAPVYDMDHIVEPLRILNVLSRAEQTGNAIAIEH